MSAQAEDRSRIPPISPKGERGTADNSFDEFWKAYPKKVGKKICSKIWGKLKPDDEFFRKIVLALEQQKKSSQWNQENGRFIPNPSTWLNQERWNDEIELPAAEVPFDHEAAAQRNKFLVEKA